MKKRSILTKIIILISLIGFIVFYLFGIQDTKYIDNIPQHFKVVKNSYIGKSESKKLQQLPSSYKDNEKKHYFQFMIDSLSSARLLQSINEMKEIYRNEIDNNGYHLNTNELAIVKEKIDFFNEFELKMNVITTGYKTENGLPGAAAGPYASTTVSEFRRTESRRNIVNQNYEHLLKSIGMSNNIDKIYIQSLEWYKSKSQKNEYNLDWKVNEMNVPEKVKLKIDKSHIQAWSKSIGSFIETIDAIDTNKNTYAIFMSDILHEQSNTHRYNWDHIYKTNENNLFNVFIHIKRHLIKNGIWETSELIINSDHGEASNERPISNLSIQNLKTKGIRTISSYYNSSFKNTSNESSYSWFRDYSSIILRKKRYSKLQKIDIDWKNVYTNADAISQLFFDMGIDPYFISFDYYNFIPKFQNTINTNGDFNSFVENPFEVNLENRKVFLFNRWQCGGWGITHEMYLSDGGMIMNGTWWKLKNNQPFLDTSKIIFFKLNGTFDGKPYLDHYRREALMENGTYGGYQVAGQLLNNLSNYIDTNS